MIKKRLKNPLALVLALLVALSGSAIGCDFPFGRESSPPTLPHLIAESEKESAPVRPIASFKEKKVVGSSFYERQLSLVETVADGFRPTFDENSSDVEAVYNKAVEELDRYILNSFTDYERVHAIHDFIAYYTEYDDELYNRFLSGKDGIKNDIDAFNPAGVLLNRRAVCDGMSKTFVLMCGIEGIKAARIEGEFISSEGSGAHAWNKVEVDGEWYNVDITLDVAHIDVGGSKIDCLHHGFFMVSDAAVSGAPFGGHRADPSIGANPVNFDAPKSYPVYESLKTDIGGESWDALITSLNELKALFRAVRKAGRKKVGKLDIKIAIDGITPGSLDSFDNLFKSASGELMGMDFTFAPEQGIRPFAQYPDGVLLVLVYR